MALGKGCRRRQLNGRLLPKNAQDLPGAGKKKISVIFVMIRNVFILGLEKHKQNVIVTKEIIGILWFKMVTAIATSTIL